MTIHLFALALIGGMAVGDPGAKAPAGNLPVPATAGDLQMDRAARDFRIQTYETFQNDRAEYDRRQSEAANLQKAWTDAGSNEAEQSKLIDWLKRASDCSRSGAVGDLPPLPQFASMPQKHESEKTRVETTGADSSARAAARIDSLLHVKTAAASGATTAATKPSTSLPAAIAGKSSRRATASLIGSLPTTFGLEVSRTLHRLSAHPRTTH